MLPVPELTIYAASAPHQSGHAKALAEGLAVHGIRSSIMRPHLWQRRQVKHVACWGWRIGKALRAMGHEVLVMERGYIGDRFAWTSLGWNGLNGRATFYPRDDERRFADNFAPLLQAWKEGGEYVLLIGQVPGDASLGGMDLTRWYQENARAAHKAYGLPVWFRPHPIAAQRGIKVQLAGIAHVDRGTLADALAKAAVVVTFNSNTAVESVLAGVPTVTLDMGSMARPVSSTAISGSLWKPDRTVWANRLAWCQWTMDEIKSGAAWEVVRPQ